jgi:hypothetical protein
MADLPYSEPHGFDSFMSPELVAAVVPNRLKNCEAYLVIILDKLTGPPGDDPETHILEPHIYAHGLSLEDAVELFRDLADNLDPEGGGDGP